MDDYWQDASISDWRHHVRESVESSQDLMRDWDDTFRDASKLLSDNYIFLHENRSEEHREPRDERELEDLFFELQRNSVVIDSVVGSACVVLMRWMEEAKIFALGAFVLLDTKFPLEPDQKSQQDISKKHNRAIMRDFGSKVPGTQVIGAHAIRQIGNVFKHGGSGSLHTATEKIARDLGFSSVTMNIPAHEDEEDLRQMALREIDYTLDSDSIERMALQLGCGPVTGLMPLYDHVESWQVAIQEKLQEELEGLESVE